MIEKISAKEMKMIEWCIDQYADSARTVSGNYILRLWDSAKAEYLNKMFGEQLILDKEIEYNMDVDELYEEMGRKLSAYGSDSPDNIRNFIKVWNDTFDPYDYGFSEDINRMKRMVCRLLDSDVLVENKWIYDTCEIKFPEMNKVIKIQHNSHPMKTISKFAEIYGIEGFEEFRIRHSQILNQRKLKGMLHLSIHPLDYMTMSDNDCGWSSCMSWEEDGCYRQGTVEMMNSPCVVVAYLDSATNMRIAGEDWSNKKWRQLFIVTPKAILNVKGYPYRNDTLTAEVLKWLKELAEKANIGTYCDDIIKYDHGREFTTNLYDYNVEVWTHTGYMYNDFSDNQFGFFTTDKELFNGGTLKINYSGKSECMSCGADTDDFQSEGALSCNECYSPKRCNECGSRLDEDEGWFIDGEWFCEDCVDSCCYVDKITGEYHALNTEEKTIYVASNNGQSYYPDFNITVEDYTFENYLKKYCLVDPHRLYKHNHYEYYIRRDELTEEGLNLFFADEFWSYNKNILDLPSDEEMLEDFRIEDLPVEELKKESFEVSA